MAKTRIKILALAILFVAGCSHKRVEKETTTQTQQSIQTKTPEAIDIIKEEATSPIAPVVNQSTAAPVMNKALPKFGFIFSGGGAKAWAHIGVIKELQKMKWPVHAVAGFEWGSVVAATYAQNLSANEVEWEMSKLKDFDKTESFVKSVFEKKSTSELKIPFVCPSLNLNKQTYFLLNRGLLDQLIPFCIAQPPVTVAYGQSVAVMSDVASLAQFLRSTGANRIVLINVLSSQKAPRSFTKDYDTAENILWVQSAALMAKKPAGVDEIIKIDLDDYGIKDLDKRRDLIAKGAELSYNQIKNLAAKYGL